MSKIYIVVIVVLAFAFRNVTANDITEKLQQYSVEGRIFDTPCMFSFDFSLLLEEKDAKEISTRQITGRQIVGTNGKFRIDLRDQLVNSKGQTTTWEHYIEVPLVEKQYCFRLDGGKLQVVKVKREEFDVMRSPIGQINPYSYAMGGGLERDRYQGNTVEIFLRNYQDFSGKMLRNKGSSAKTACVPVFDLQPHPKIVSFKFLKPSKKCQNDSAIEWKQIKSDKDVLADWHVWGQIDSKWSSVDGNEVPVYVHSYNRYHVCDDPSATEEFEGYFFDYKFRPIDEKIYFSSDRLTEEHLERDFPFKLLLDGSAAAKK